MQAPHRVRPVDHLIFGVGYLVLVRRRVVRRPQAEAQHIGDEVGMRLPPFPNRRGRASAMEWRRIAVHLPGHSPLREETQQRPINEIRIVRITWRPDRTWSQMPLDQPDRGSQVSCGHRIISLPTAAGNRIAPLQAPQDLRQILVIWVRKLQLELTAPRAGSFLMLPIVTRPAPHA